MSLLHTSQVHTIKTFPKISMQFKTYFLNISPKKYFNLNGTAHYLEWYSIIMFWSPACYLKMKVFIRRNEIPGFLGPG